MARRPHLHLHTGARLQRSHMVHTPTFTARLRRTYDGRLQSPATGCKVAPRARALARAQALFRPARCGDLRNAQKAPAKRSAFDWPSEARCPRAAAAESLLLTVLHTCAKCNLALRRWRTSAAAVSRRGAVTSTWRGPMDKYATPCFALSACTHALLDRVTSSGSFADGAV